jgi:hypothetical protein
MKKIIGAVCLFYSFSLHAQQPTDTTASPMRFDLYNYTHQGLSNLFNEQLSPDTKNRITIDGEYSNNSNAAPALMGYSILLKSTISNALKDRADKLIKKDLKFDDFLKTGISYRRYFQKSDLTMIVGYHHRQMRILKAPKDAFQTVFYGNARFEDQTADFSNITFQNHIYNQYSVGISKKISYPKYQMEFGVVGSLLQGINHLYLNTNTTSIYTAPDGEYLDIKYDLTFNGAKEGAVKFTELNGVGASVDMHLAFMNNNKWRVALDVMDIGQMIFKKNPYNYTGTKDVRFQGIVLPDLLTFSPQTFDTLNLDSTLRTYLPNKSGNRYYVFMPFTAQLVFSKPINDKLVISAGLQYRFMPGYNVYGFAKVNYFLKKNAVISGSVGAGGYSLVNVGVDFTKRWKYFDLTVGTANLLGLVAPTHLPGTSIYIRLASSF